jgi:hypothetical protein
LSTSNIDIKKEFQVAFLGLLKSEVKIQHLFYETFLYGTAYIVGGFFRDFLNKNPSRDLDVIVDISHTKLIEILDELKIEYVLNRHKGIKILFNVITVDIWCIENNWAFRNDLVKLNDDDKLSSIVRGCFFNYDALVINLNNFSYNIQHYKNFQKFNIVDILQRSPKYKNLNPTTEANILRAIFIREKFQSSFSDNLLVYLVKKLGSLKDKYNDEILRLLTIKEKYKKYNELTEQMLISRVVEIKKMSLSNNQQHFDF